MKNTILITNATGIDMELRWHHKRIQQRVEIPKYALNIEYTFDDEEDMKTFFSLYGYKEEIGELIFGKTSENKAVDANGAFEEKDKDDKQARADEVTANFEDSVNVNLGDKASLKVTSQKGKGGK